jgi:hypothetical protein
MSKPAVLGGGGVCCRGGGQNVGFASPTAFSILLSILQSKSKHLKIILWTIDIYMEHLRKPIIEKVNFEKKFICFDKITISEAIHILSYLLILFSQRWGYCEVGK